MLTGLDDALAMMAQAVTPVTGRETVALADAVGRVAAGNVIAPRALPPFTNTGVDGYAFRHDGATSFQLAGASFAGAPFAGILAAGTAARIATGAVLPDGADTVAMQEVCTLDGDRVHIGTLPKKGDNIRPAGADIAEGALAVAFGTVLKPQHIALVGALGIPSIDVVRRPRVAICSTGQELAQTGDRLAHGQIVDTNSLMLRQLLVTSGADVTILPALPDLYAETCDALKQAAERYDLIVTTGGVSVGDRDFVRDGLRDMGQVLFWKLAIRPGKPVMVGRMDDCWMAGLPGNPVSAFVTFFLIVRPLLDALLGTGCRLPPGFPLPLAAPLSKPASLRCFSRAVLMPNAEGLKVRETRDQSSNLFTSLSDSDGLLDLPAGVDRLEAGKTVLFRPYGGLLG